MNENDLEELDGIPSINGKGKFSKGFYIVLAVCVALLAIGGFYLLNFKKQNVSNKEKAKEHVSNMKPFPDFVAPPPPPPPVITPPPTVNMVDKNRPLTKQERLMLRGMGSSDGQSSAPKPPEEKEEKVLDANGFDKSDEGELAASLKPTKVEMVGATILPDRNYLLTRGTGFDCDIEAALDSRMPGFLTCIVARDVYSESGNVVLVERGSQLDGEARGGSSVTAGQVRIGVLWNRIKTTKGVVVNLNSPATDSLGRTGVEGFVDNHFWSRFGAAIAISLIDTTSQIAASRLIPSNGGTTNNFGNGFGGGGGGRAIVDGILSQQINIPPSIVTNQGSRIRVTLARDLSFSSVYKLKARP